MKSNGYREFLELCQSLKSVEDLEKIFDLFFTHEEKEQLGKRLLIVKALLEGHLSQRKIAETFHVSIAQITRGSNALKLLSDQTKSRLSSWL